MANRIAKKLWEMGYNQAEFDYPNFKSEEELVKNHGPARRNGYKHFMAEVQHHDEESQWEHEMERAAERYYEEGPAHLVGMDDPRGY